MMRAAHGSSLCMSECWDLQEASKQQPDLVTRKGRCCRIIEAQAQLDFSPKAGEVSSFHRSLDCIKSISSCLAGDAVSGAHRRD